MSLFRFMKVDDLSRATELLRQIGSTDFPAPSEGMFLDFINLSVFHPFVLENDDGLIVALVVLTRMPNLKYGWRGYIDYFVVDEPYRHRGFGHELARNLIVAAKELGCRTLLLTTSNPVARGIYESVGFSARTNSISMELAIRC